MARVSPPTLDAVKVVKRGRKPRKATAKATEVVVQTSVNTDTPKQMTPCQRMKALLAAKALERKESAPVVSTVENLREFLQRKGELIPIVIRMKLVWITDHVYGTWKLVRLHFTDAEAPESLDNLLSVYKTPYEANREDIASALLTVTIWNVESDSELLPLPGSVVDINEYANLQLYRDKQCQLPTRLPQMIWSNEQSSPV